VAKGDLYLICQAILSDVGGSVTLNGCTGINAYVTGLKIAYTNKGRTSKRS
jgi:hypothetical protein